MGMEIVGKVLVAAKVENIVDLFLVQQGSMSDGDVRRMEVDEALVDIGATTLAMPGRFIRQLGLMPLRTRQARTTAGPATFHVFGAVRLTVQGRECTVDVTELPGDCPVLIGQVPLELLDFIVDPGRRQLIGNPEHGGEQMFDMY